MKEYILTLGRDEALITAEALATFLMTIDASKDTGVVSEEEYKEVEGIILSITHKLYDAAGMDYDAALAKIREGEKNDN